MMVDASMSSLSPSDRYGPVTIFRPRPFAVGPCRVLGLVHEDNLPVWLCWRDASRPAPHVGDPDVYAASIDRFGRLTVEEMPIRRYRAHGKMWVIAGDRRAVALWQDQPDQVIA